MITAIIIVNYKTPWHLEQCLLSVFKHTKDFHIFLVHNSLDAASIRVGEKIKKRFPNEITIITNQQNLGLVGGVNSAYPEAIKYERVCFLNSDIIVTPNWLKELNIALDENPKAVQVSPDSNQFHREGLIWRFIKWQVMKKWPSLGAKLYKFQIYFNPPRDIDTGVGYRPIKNFFQFPGGYCNIVRTFPFKDLGYFWDPNIIHGYWDDFDTSFFLRQFGEVGSTMKSYVYHFVNASFDKVDEGRENLKQKLMLYNGLYVMDKWSKKLEEELGKLSDEELVNSQDSYVVQMILTYFGLVKIKPEIVKFIQSIPAREIGKSFLK